MIRSSKMIIKKMAALAIMVAFAAVGVMAAEKEAMVVSDGNTVKVHYTLTVEEKVVDSSEGKDPLSFQVGGGGVIPGFEKNVIGMKVGDKKSFTLSPEEGYGPHNPEAMREIQKSQLPENITPEPNMVLYAQSQTGQPMPVRIAEVKGDTVVLDFNHPMAGKTLNFSVEVVEIQ